MNEAKHRLARRDYECDVCLRRFKAGTGCWMTGDWRVDGAAARTCELCWALARRKQRAAPHGEQEPHA